MSNRVLGLAMSKAPLKLQRHMAVLLADTVLVGYAAMAQEPWLRAMTLRVAQMFPGTVATWGPTSVGVGVETATQIHGAACVALELDEGNQFAEGHPACHIVPAVLALWQSGSAPVDNMTVVSAIWSGYEAAVDIASRYRLHDAVHPHGTWGTVGAAVACGRILGLSTKEIESAVDIALGLMVTSSQRAALVGSPVRNIATGIGAANGVAAALWAAAGVEGERGVEHLTLGTILGRPKPSLDLTTDKHFLQQNYFKLYSSSRWCHAAIEAAAEIRQRMGERGQTPQDVSTFLVETYDPATRLSNPQPENVFASRFSIEFGVAVMLVTGRADPTVYTREMLHDGRVRELGRAGRVVEDPAMSAMLPHIRPAKLTVQFRDGSSDSCLVNRPRGNFDNPYTEQELQEKHRSLIGNPDLVTRIWNAAIAFDIPALVSNLTASA